MSVREILGGRQRLKKAAGKLEYYFFTSMLLSAFLICVILVIAFDAFFKSEPVQSVYVGLFSKSVSSAANLSLGNLPEFTQNLLKVLGSLLVLVFENAPTVVSFLLVSIFLLCPVYQGTVRYCAYLIEENRALPLTAVLFYFASPSLYFSSVLLSVGIAVRKWLSAVAFLLPSALFFALGTALDSTYVGQDTLGSSIKLLSLVLLLLSLLLHNVFLNRYVAVRYLFALGSRKKLFKASAQLTKNHKFWLFYTRLGLLVNLVPALFIIPAPICLTRILSGEGLIVKSLIKTRREKAVKAV